MDYHCVVVGAGLRYIFGKIFGLYIESDYKLDALILGLTVKLN
jgi:hypothetical protein